MKSSEEFGRPSSIFEPFLQLTGWISRWNRVGMVFALELAMNFFLLLLLLVPMTANANANTARDPSIQAVQQQAIRYMGDEAGQFRSWEKRAKLAAALPRLQVGFQRDLKDVVSLKTSDNISVKDGDVFVGPNENDFDQNFNQGTVIGVKAYWYLDQLVFNRDLLAVGAQKREWVKERSQALQRVTEAYFTRQRLLAELKKPVDPPPIREKKKLLLDQATSVIDALTGGWFSQSMSTQTILGVKS